MPAGSVRRRGRVIAWVASATTLVLCCAGTLVFTFFSGQPDSDAINLVGCGTTNAINVDGELPSVGNLNEEQRYHAAVIIKVGQDKQIPPRGWVIAIATAMQESTLHNYGHLGDANDHDSLGLFQQRPSMGWGTPAQILDPEYSAGRFYGKLKTIEGWEKLPLTIAAQRVQVSAFPDAYAKWEPLATDVVNVLTDGAARAAVGANAGTCANVGEISASGWTAPVQEGIVSGYRTAERPTHDGVDLGSPRGTVIHAASAGVVSLMMCNASYPGGGAYSCDVDGSPSIMGCGWYVEITHAAGVVTRYCHMVKQPDVFVGQKVVAGQPIGIVGTSGNSSGPHLHFEVHLNNDTSSSGATDPGAFMQLRGAPLQG
ncbi:M23 family metallopeptidase [Phytomonospora sp. NPDC050363]|uniref:M23 family metallopeptidase n=1 Tax=Phytomonospora sp. NPDC050363 TaxID=3155642 RepID=UPI0033E3DF7F